MDIAKRFQELLGNVPDDQLESLITMLKDSQQMAQLCKDLVVNRALYRAGVLSLEQIMAKNRDEIEEAIAAHVSMLMAIKSGDENYMDHITNFIVKDPG